MPRLTEGWKRSPPFVGPDRAVHLDAEPAVNCDLAFVVLPGHAEHDDAFRLDHALEDFGLHILRMPFENEGERFGHLLHGLVKLRFRRILGLHPRDQFSHILSHKFRLVRRPEAGFA